MSTEYIEPKTSWSGNQAPLPSDMNRIEGNTKANHESLIIEATARFESDQAEAIARNNAINTEAIARNNAINTESTARQNADNAIIAGGFNIESRTTDPSNPAIGHMWLRIDL